MYDIWDSVGEYWGVRFRCSVDDVRCSGDYPVYMRWLVRFDIVGGVVDDDKVGLLIDSEYDFVDYGEDFIVFLVHEDCNIDDVVLRLKLLVHNVIV